MAEKRSRFILYSGILLLAFVLLDPFNIVPDRGARRPGVDTERATAMAQHLEVIHRSPEDYLLDMLEEHRVVLLGTIGRIREHTEFVSHMVEAIPLADVHTLGVDFVRADDQDVLDRLVDGPEFDRRTAADLLLRRDVLSGFEDYVDILESVWEYNSARGDGTEAIRVIALSQQFFYDEIETEADMNDPETMRSVIREGPPDTFMAERVLNTIVEDDRRALVFMRLPHALSGFSPSSVEEEMADLGFEGIEPTGVQLRNAIDEEVATILLHSPWPDSSRMQGMTFAADGYIEAVLDLVPEGMSRMGFSPGQDPVGSLGVQSSQFGDPDNPRAFHDITDGYIILERSSDLSASRLIPDFYTADNIAFARQNFPGPEDTSMDEQSLQEFVRGIVQAYDRNLQEFQ